MEAGWRLVLQWPSDIPGLLYLSNRDMRSMLGFFFFSKAAHLSLTLCSFIYFNNKTVESHILSTFFEEICNKFIVNTILSVFA